MYEELIAKMTLKEKASLCSGLVMWHTKPIERLGIPSIMMADGPHGLRKQPGTGDNLGLNVSAPATCFPTASAIASSWDRELAGKIGEAIAEECLKEGVSMVLGPGINIKRNPLCGRNFEYYSEDPYISGQMAQAFIEGVHSKGVGTSIKHFAANNQEDMRMTVNAVVDERTLREIYLSAFEYAIKTAKPWTVMCAYNRLNGDYCSENKRLLKDILVDEWGYEGLVVTDWGACNNRVYGLKSGQTLEMPGGGWENDKTIEDAVENGSLDMSVLDKAVEQILNLVFTASKNLHTDYVIDMDTHHELAKSAAISSAVLLKNDDDMLPINKDKKIALIGQMAVKPRYQGSGSSLINPTRLESAYETFKTSDIDFEYAEGYDIGNDKIDVKYIGKACEAARHADIVIIFAGLTVLYESEGFDREHMRLPENQNVLIKEICRVNPNTVVVLSGGSPVEMPWVKDVKAILNMYLSGQAGGSAVFDLLMGKANPSGKLAETYPLKYGNCISASCFPGGPETVEYRESIYVGYRYYDTAKKDVLFPFGHGLSYTNFEYMDISLSKESIEYYENLKVKVKIKNTGKLPGSEVVQLYIHHNNPMIFKAEKELKGFEKIYLQPGEERQVEFILDKRSFAYYNININDWYVEGGEYEIMAGSSSRDIRLTSKINIISNVEVEVPDYRNTAPGYYSMWDGQCSITEEEFECIYGGSLPCNSKKDIEFTINSTLHDVKTSLVGRLLHWYIIRHTINISGKGRDENSQATRNMMKRMMPQNTLRNLVLLSGGSLSFKTVEGLLFMMNGKPIRGLAKILKSGNRK